MHITDVQVIELTRVPYAVLNTLTKSPRNKTYNNYQLLKSLQARSLILEDTLLPEERAFIELSKDQCVNVERVEGVCFVVSTDRPEEWEHIERNISLHFPSNATAYYLDSDSLVLVLLEIPHSLFRIYWSLFASMMDIDQQQEAISA